LDNQIDGVQGSLVKVWWLWSFLLIIN
jgi:hypothetical protein